MEMCSQCRQRPAVIFSRAHEYGLCRECAWLLYPQIDIHQAETEQTAIEDARAHAEPYESCRICGVRSSQVHTDDGRYCIVCAKRLKLPQADKFAARMGIAADDLADFAQKVDAAERTAQSPDCTDSGQDPAARFRLLNRYDVDGRTLLIVLDAETGIQYLTNPQFSGFSPLLDSEGRPMLYRVPEIKEKCE